MFDPALRDAAQASKAWPFEEARKLVARVERTGQTGGAVRDRLWPLGPAAYRHLRRSRAHHHGAPCVPGADRRQDQDPAARLLRRHGRPAQGSRQRAEQGHVARPSRQAADRACPTRSARTRASARTTTRMLRALPRRVRLRLRVRVVDRLLHVRPLRRGAAAHAARASTRCMAIMLPSLREERAATYSPFLPIHPETGIVMQVPIDGA